MLVSGLGTWLVGSAGLHIGASGIIFGYLGFLLRVATLNATFPQFCSQSLSVSSTVVAIWGVLPTQPGVSWEGTYLALSVV
jgi:membrane associated rhomboid family serine protease